MDYTVNDFNQDLKYLRGSYHTGTYSLQNLLKHRNDRNQMIFPKYFPVSNNELPTFVKAHDNFDLQDLKYPKVFKPTESKSVFTEKLKNSNYFDHTLHIYHDLFHSKTESKQCKNNIEVDAKIQVDTAVSIDSSLPEILQRFIDELDSNSFYHEIAPLFLKDLRFQLKHKVVEQYWYKLAASSVWLEEYQVHFVISRILYSYTHIRNQPRVSFFYAQVYDKNWNELTNTKLVVPTNDLDKKESDSKDSEQHYKVLSFPYFLPIPFYNDYDDTWGRYYGPEDPRILMVKNKAGYEEPLIVFNLYHQKLEYDKKKGKTEPNHYRNMFVSWPWQFQKGKFNMDGFSDPTYLKNYYNRAVELGIKNLRRTEKQKNWTPFVSNLDRIRNGYDKTLNFIYRWSDFEVLKCDLDKNVGSCNFNYKMDPKKLSTDSVGPLRGGTELININALLGDDIKKYVPSHREILVGFARAHIDNCGCGENMYRPNLVVVTKDVLNPATSSLNSKRQEIGEELQREEEIQKEESQKQDSPKEKVTEEELEQEVTEEQKKEAEEKKKEEAEKKKEEAEKKKEADKEKKKEEEEKKKEEQEKKKAEEEERKNMVVIDYEDTHYKIAQISSFISFDIPIIGWNLLDPNNVCQEGPNILIPNGISNWVIDHKGEDDFEDFLTLSLSLSDFTNHRINIKGLLKQILLVNKGHVGNEIIDLKDLIGFNNDNLDCAMEISKQFCHDFGIAHGVKEEEDKEDEGKEEEEPQVEIPKVFLTPELKTQEEIELFNPEQVLQYQVAYPKIDAYEDALNEYNKHKKVLPDDDQ